MDEAIEQLVGGRVDVMEWTIGKPLEQSRDAKEVDLIFEPAVRIAINVHLASASEIGVLLESTSPDQDGAEYFRPWSSIIYIRKSMVNR